MSFIADNQKYHPFSKSPIKPGSSVGIAINKSGHTVSINDIQCTDIPWFVNIGAEEDLSEIQPYARHNDIAYWGSFKSNSAQCKKFKAKIEDENGNLIELPKNECIWEDYNVFSSDTILFNENNKPVIKFYYKKNLEGITADNNAGLGANNWSAFVIDDSGDDKKYIEQFVAPTDKIHSRLPSIGYNPIVYINDIAMDESEEDEEYIANTFAGIIQFNKKRTDLSSIKVSVFEYIGDKLNEYISNITTIPDTVAVKKYIDNHTIYNGVNSNNWNIIQDGSSAFTTSSEGSLPSSMPSLTVATGMFGGNTAITEFNIKVPNLVIADNMFSGCTNLTTIDSSFQNVVSATNMFENCPLTSIKLTQPGFANLTEAATYTTDETTNKTTKEKGLFDSAKETLVTATVSMPSLINGTELFKDFTALESYNGNLNQLEDGNAMFRGCSSMTSFSGDLSSLSNGRWMFGNTALSAWNNDILKLKDGYAMFFNCSNLTNFTGDIPLLENGVYMFGHTSNLISFTGSLESLVDGHQMFYGNGTSPSDTEKFTFTSNLSKLQNGHRMFYNNKRLGSFNIVEGSNLDSLLFSKHMFTGTSLTEFRYNLPNVGSYETYYDPNEKREGTEGTEGTTFYKYEAATAMFQNCTSLTTVVSDLSSITNGSMLFFGCTNLQTVDCDFSSMTDHGNMFSGCTSLTSFTANLSSLPDGQCQSLLNMFRGDTFTKIQHISGDMSNLRTGNHCMKEKTSLASFDVNLPSLYDASEMFLGCTALETFNSKSGLPALVSGHNMFNGCSSLTSFSGDMTIMTNGNGMFQGCSSLTTFNATVPKMEVATEMFASTKIAKFVEVDLSSLKVAPRMFSNNKTLTEFKCDLPALTNSIEDNENLAKITNWKPTDAAYPKNGFFNHCESLESFSGNLSSLVSGYKMFVNCYKLGSFDAGTDGLKSLECGALMFMNCGNNVTDEEKKFTSFSADLSALKDGYGMFWGIDTLTSFNAGTEGLKSLERGINMFSNCRLDADSVEHILTTIPDYEGTPILPLNQSPADENEGKGYLQICMQQSAAETFVRIYTEHEGITPTINANGEYNVDGAGWMDFRGWKIGAMIIN